MTLPPPQRPTDCDFREVLHFWQECCDVFNKNYSSYYKLFWVMLFSNSRFCVFWKIYADDKILRSGQISALSSARGTKFMASIEYGSHLSQLQLNLNLQRTEIHAPCLFTFLYLWHWWKETKGEGEWWDSSGALSDLVAWDGGGWGCYRLSDYFTHRAGYTVVAKSTNKFQKELRSTTKYQKEPMSSLSESFQGKMVYFLWVPKKYQKITKSFQGILVYFLGAKKVPRKKPRNTWKV